MATYNDKGVKLTKSNISVAGFGLTQIKIAEPSAGCLFATVGITRISSAALSAVTVIIKNDIGTQIFSYGSANTGSGGSPFLFVEAPGAIATDKGFSRICGPLGNAAYGTIYTSGTTFYSSFGPCFLVFPGETVWIVGTTGTTHNATGFMIESFGA